MSNRVVQTAIHALNLDMLLSLMCTPMHECYAPLSVVYLPIPLVLSTLIANDIPAVSPNLSQICHGDTKTGWIIWADEGPTATIVNPDVVK